MVVSSVSVGKGVATGCGSAAGRRRRARKRLDPRRRSRRVGQDEQMAAVDDLQPRVGQPRGDDAAVDRPARSGRRRPSASAPAAAGGQPEPARPADTGQQLVEVAAPAGGAHRAGVLGEQRRGRGAAAAVDVARRPRSM